MSSELQLLKGLLNLITDFDEECVERILECYSNPNKFFERTEYLNQGEISKFKEDVNYKGKNLLKAVLCIELFEDEYGIYTEYDDMDSIEILELIEFTLQRHGWLNEGEWNLKLEDSKLDTDVFLDRFNKVLQTEGFCLLGLVWNEESDYLFVVKNEDKETVLETGYQLNIPFKTKFTRNIS